MKILRIYLKLPPLKGGMEKHIKSLSQWQIQNHHDITLCFNDGCPISEHDIQIFPKTKLYGLKPQVLGVLIFYFFLCIYLFQKKKQFDVIHIHGDWSSLVFANIVKKITKARLLVFSMHDQIGDGFTHTTLLSYLLQKVDLVFSTGYDTVKALKKITNKQIIVQPSGVNELFFQDSNKIFNDKNNKNIVTVANLLPKKNIDLILDIAKEMQDIHFNIIGDGPLFSQLKEKIEKGQLDNVQLLGSKSAEEVFNAYIHADCYLLTSFAEGTPTSMMEAMVVGVPVVSSNAGGVDNIIINGENGYVVKNMKKELYVKSLNKILYNQELSIKISKNNQLKGKKFSWNYVAKRITTLIQEALNEKN